MKAYVSVAKLRFINGLQYRSAAYAGMATQVFFGLIFIMVYVAFYTHSSGEFPISLKEVVVYIWLQQIFLALIMLWFRDPDIFQLITSGNIAYELCRPCEIYSFWFAKLLSQRLSAALLRSLPIIMVALLLPEPYRLSLPPSWISMLLFIVTLILGLFVVVAISMLIYISVFWTLSPTGSLLMMSVTGEFFAGMVIPIPLMPDWLQQVAMVLPFRWTMDFPFRVYSGHIPQEEALLGIIVQLLWLLLLIGVGRWTMKKALRQVVVQGG